MHDVLEGVLQYETKLLLLHCVNSHIFSLNDLNSKIQSFELCNGMESDRPTPIDRNTLFSGGNLLKQKGMYLNFYLEQSLYM